MIATPMDLGAIETTRYVVNIHNDEGTYAPQDEWDTLFELVSFNTRHIHFLHPDEVFSCVKCGNQENWYYHNENTEDYDDYEEHKCDYARNPRIVALLQYYEHGRCRWSLQNYDAPGEEFTWDGVRFAGVLLVRDDEAEWFAEQSDEFKIKAMSSFVDEYTSWANGDVYWVDVHEIVEDQGGSVISETELDNIGCLVGDVNMDYAVSESLGKDWRNRKDVEVNNPWDLG